METRNHVLKFEPNRSLRKKTVETSQGKVTVREFTRREEIDFHDKVGNSNAVTQIAYLFPHLFEKHKLTDREKDLILSALSKVNSEIPLPSKSGGKYLTLTEHIFILCKEGIGSFIEIENNFSSQQIREIIHAHGNFCDEIYKNNKNSSSPPPRIDPKNRRRKPDPNIKTPEPPDYLLKGVKNNNDK